MDTTKKTIIVFSDDFDRAMAAFIIANGAAAMGDDVTMFFTFWGLDLIRKKQKIKVPGKKHASEHVREDDAPRSGQGEAFEDELRRHGRPHDAEGRESSRRDAARRTDSRRPGAGRQIRGLHSEHGHAGVHSRRTARRGRFRRSRRLSEPRPTKPTSTSSFRILAPQQGAGATFIVSAPLFFSRACGRVHLWGSPSPY